MSSAPLNQNRRQLSFLEITSFSFACIQHTYRAIQSQRYFAVGSRLADVLFHVGMAVVTVAAAIPTVMVARMATLAAMEVVAVAAMVVVVDMGAEV